MPLTCASTTGLRELNNTFYAFHNQNESRKSTGIPGYTNNRVDICKLVFTGQYLQFYHPYSYKKRDSQWPTILDQTVETQSYNSRI